MLRATLRMERKAREYKQKLKDKELEIQYQASKQEEIQK